MRNEVASKYSRALFGLGKEHDNLLDLKENLKLEAIKNEKFNKDKTNKSFKKFFREIEAEIDKIIKKLRND